MKASKMELNYLLVDGSEDSNVNKSAFEISDREVQCVRKFDLIRVWMCNLHIADNAFGKDIICEPFSNITDLFEYINYWFVKFPSR